MTLLIRDEESIIEANIDYHLSRGVDFILVMDNLSTDKTTEILKRYESKGVLKYIFQPDDDYSQDLWVTQMANMAINKYSADWVIHVDADEFWWPQNELSFKTVLGNIPSQYDGITVQRNNFFYPASISEDTLFFNRMIHRQVHSTNILGKPLPPKVGHRSKAHIQINQGNHSFMIKGQPPQVLDSNDLTILHFPVRSKKDFIHRIQQGGDAYNRNTRFSKEIGETWRKLHDALGKSEFEEYFSSVSISDQVAKQMIAEGDVVEDIRFREYMLNLYSCK